MTKKVVHAMNPKCNTNGRTDADKYPGHDAGSDSMATFATSPLITFFLLLRLECSSTLTEDFSTLRASLDLEISSDKNTSPQLFSSMGVRNPSEKKFSGLDLA